VGQTGGRTVQRDIFRHSWGKWPKSALLDALNAAEIERDKIEYELVQVEEIGPEPKPPPEELKKNANSIE
jgi:hypothetical protein